MDLLLNDREANTTHHRPKLFDAPNGSNYQQHLRVLSSRHEFVRYGGILWVSVGKNEECHVPSPLGDKINAQRKLKGLSLEQLAEMTDSSKSYLWELENKDDPNPTIDKVTRLATALDVTTEYLLAGPEATADETVTDQAFFRRYQSLPDQEKKKLRKILDAWEDE
jgi:transcriptional regulator with XRE-family HTH domain